MTTKIKHSISNFTLLIVEAKDLTKKEVQLRDFTEQVPRKKIKQSNNGSKKWRKKILNFEIVSMK